MPELCQRDPQRTFARGADFVSDGIIVLQVEREQKRLERQPLEDERAEHHGERGNHDQVTTAARTRPTSASSSLMSWSVHDCSRCLARRP